MFHTGAALWHPSTGEVVIKELDSASVAEVAATAERHGWVFEAYSWDDLAVDSDAPLAVAHAGLLGLTHRRRPIDALDAPVVRAQLVVPIADTQAAIDTAPKGCTASAATSPVMTGAAFVSVTVDDVSKAEAVSTVATGLSVPTAAVMMVGDGHNDLSAMAVVGWPVAIGDAAPEVIAAARIVVAAVDDDGAAEAIDLSATLTP